MEIDLALNNEVEDFKEDYETYGELVYRDGKLRGIKNLQIKNKYINCIVPRNSEQACLFDILNNHHLFFLQFC